ncbi:MAG: ribonuclease E/G [Candidatus Paracaedibacter sp.]
MPITLLISQKDHFRRVAYLKDDQLIDIDLEWPPSRAPSFASLDQIYWGRVLRVESTHAFIKLARNTIGLLPFESSFPKPIEGQALLVQVRREAIPDKGTHHKGTLLTRKITLGGRYCLYHPFLKERQLSSKIQDHADKKRLQEIIPGNEPVTLREASIQASLHEILTEISTLRQKFQEIEALYGNAPCLTPYDALPPSHRWMRDLEASEGDIILGDNDKTLIDVRQFLKTHRPDLLPYVQKHKAPLFEAFGLEDFWECLFQDVIALPSGGNIVIDATAAAIVIDVNQGDQGAKETNKEAIPIIIQHLKCRHLGGNIIIDFMGVEASPKDRAALQDLLQKQAAIYHLPLNIFGWSKLGWMEVRLPKRRLPLGEIVDLIKN